MPYTLVAHRFKTPFEPDYDTPEWMASLLNYPCGHPHHAPYDPHRSIEDAKAAAEKDAGRPLEWRERAVQDGTGFHPWRGKPHLCAWALGDPRGNTQYLITDGIGWIGWADDPALAGYNAAMRHMGRPEREPIG
jgi:hypothetical protein